VQSYISTILLYRRKQTNVATSAFRVMHQQGKFTSKANQITLHLPCLTAVDGFSFPDLTCALARCSEDASNWAAFIYNTSCSTCLGRGGGKKKSNYVSKHLSWTYSSHGQTSHFNHNRTQGPAAAAKEARCLKCNSTPPFPSQTVCHGLRVHLLIW